MTQTQLGTPMTMAPEIISSKPYGSECDIYSLGVIFYQLIYGKYPFNGGNLNELHEKIKK